MPTRKRAPRPHLPPDLYESAGDIDDHYRLLYHGHDAPALGNQVDARYLTLPSIAIIAIVLAGVWTTYTVLQERNRIDNRINATIEAVREVANAVRALGENFPSIIANVSADRYTRTQHDAWCVRFELENQKLGIKCPPVPIGPNSIATPGPNGPRYYPPNFSDRVNEGLSRAQQ